MSNALAQESSPYLRQHASNPVDWLPWGPVALERARALDRPLLVSIGYSSCHWCHVMERESFEDPAVADLMNENFVSVKVDREERPDIDAIYMEAVQTMTGHGGWPLNVFLTPEQLPFYGGTYFPPERPDSPLWGSAGAPSMPSWPEVLRAVAEAWRTRSEELRAGGELLRERLSGAALLEPSEGELGPRTIELALQRLRDSFDEINGGFGRAPKFPPTSALEFLLARGRLDIALATLRAMAAGGIHDQVGGGFHRYSVDPSWTVPHFEKMLYDNALLARAYLHGWQLSGEERLLEVCTGALDWALREMRGPEGGFYSALDADAGGVEGRSYVWTLAELRRALGDDAEAAIAWFGASAEGNFSDPHHPVAGLNVLTARGPAPAPEVRERIRARLLEDRGERPQPGVDEKRLTSWNALMVSALADAGSVLGERRYLEAAAACAEFLLGELRDPAGRLLRTYSAGEARLDGYLEDHAFLLEALITLYEATFDERWFLEARRLAGVLHERFADPDRGGFFSTASDHEPLIARRKDLEDAPIPAGASSAALGLFRLAALSGEALYEGEAVSVLLLGHELAAQYPLSFGHLLQAIDFHVSGSREVALVGPPEGPRGALEAIVRSRPRPRLVLAAGSGRDEKPSAVPLLEGRSAPAGGAAAYVCERFACLEPVSEPARLAALLDRG
jgi:uncharacterized protein YyaL (SSP411 family)